MPVTAFAPNEVADLTNPTPNWVAPAAGAGLVGTLLVAAMTGVAYSKANAATQGVAAASTRMTEIEDRMAAYENARTQLVRQMMDQFGGMLGHLVNQAVSQLSARMMGTPPGPQQWGPHPGAQQWGPQPQNWGPQPGPQNWAAAPPQNGHVAAA